MSERPIERAVRKAVTTRGDLPQRRKALRSESIKRGIDYAKGPGKFEPIPVMPTPAVLSGAHVRFLRRLTTAVNDMIRRMPDLFLADPVVRAMLPFPADEERWVRACYRSGTRQPLVTRIDYDVPNATADSVRDTVAYEPNGTSIGGLYYASACPRMLADIMLGRPVQQHKLCLISTPCAGVVRLLARHGRSLGLGTHPRIGILEDRDWTDGITEMPRLAEALEAAGMPAVEGDPRDLHRVRGQLTLAGKPVDLIYRNMEVRDLADIEAKGVRLTALRQAFKEDRVISGIAGDFEHKSLWEVLTSDRSAHVIPRRLRRLFRQHLLWTRLLRDIHTDGPDGREIDLIPWIRRHREALVLKPNRSCGGDRVTIGMSLKQEEWDRVLDSALATKESWVVQTFHQAECKRFPTGRGRQAELQEAFVCYGVIAVGREVDILGRACARRVVNVSAGGGLMAVFRKD
jgi:hypothetical protein